MMRVTSLNMRNNPLPKFHWMWFSHSDRPSLFKNKESRFMKNGNPESKHTQNALITHGVVGNIAKDQRDHAQRQYGPCLMGKRKA